MSYPSTHVSLMDGWADGDPDSIRRLVETYSGPIYSTANRLLRNPEDAFDLTQQVLLQLIENRGAFRFDRNRGRFRSWLASVTRNAVRNFISRNQRRQDLDLLVARSDEIADDIGEKIEREHRRQVLDEVMKAVEQRVGPETWERWKLFKIDGLASDEIAARVGCPVSAIHDAVRRVKDRLREELHSRGIESLADLS